MVARRLLVAAVLVTVAVISTGASARPATLQAPTVYRLRGDLRMCPSPMCGGFWASRINRAPATCLDGVTRTACYAASIDLSALTPKARAHAQPPLSAGRALVAGAFARYSNEFPQLGKLVATRVWLATGGGDETGTVYLVVDTGLRCIRAPCFSLRATVVNGTRSLTLSGLDLAATGASAAGIARAYAALAHSGVLAAGAIRAATKPGVSEVGRTLEATQVWLPA